MSYIYIYIYIYIYDISSLRVKDMTRNKKITKNTDKSRVKMIQRGKKQRNRNKIF